MGESRRQLLIGIVEEHIENGVGATDWHDIVKKMLSDGDITDSEIMNYGIDGFHRSIIRPAQKARDGLGRDKYIVTKQGGIRQLHLAEQDDVNRTYWERKHHVAAASVRLAILRQQIIDVHGFDPETLADPFAKKDAAA
ncbi:MAG: hypothetical protein ACE5FA_05165 [Dehalococcoidia bacterium]